MGTLWNALLTVLVQKRMAATGGEALLDLTVGDRHGFLRALMWRAVWIVAVVTL